MTSLFATAGIPIVLLWYSTWTTHVGANSVGLLDHAVLVLLFLLIYGTFLRLRSGFLRAVSSFALTTCTATFFLLNTLHFRFFSTWGEVNAVQQWSDLTSILSGIRSLLHPADGFFFVAVPVALWACSLRRPSPSLRILARVLVPTIAALCIAHALWVSPEVLYFENNPLLYALRQRFNRSSHEFSGLEPGADAQPFQAINPSLYVNPDRADFPLMKIPRKSIVPLSIGFRTTPNVVLILMESVRAYESGAYGAHPSLTPNIDRLAREGLLFENYYANGSQTVRSEFAIHASFMPRMIGSPEYITDPHAPFLTWPMILRHHGYETMWIGSYTPVYDNKQDFQSHHGIDHFYWNVPHSGGKVGWGPSDEELFAYASGILSRQKSPYFAEIMTLSNHYPWDDGAPTAAITPHVEGEPLYQKYAQGMFYTDYAIGIFFDQVRRTHAFDHTLFIITGDHGIWLFPNDASLSHSVLRQEAYFRVPLVMWAPSHLKPRVVRTLGSHVDLGPTVLDLLGLYETNYFLGTSLLRNDVQKRFVLMVQDGRWNLRQGSFFTYDIGPQVFESHYPFDETLYNRVVKGKKIGHITFSFSGDLLRDRNPSPLEPLDESVMEPQRHFAESALQFYQELLQDGKTAPKDTGVTRAGKSPNSGN